MKYKMTADQVLKRFSRQIRKEDAFIFARNQKLAKGWIPLTMNLDVFAKGRRSPWITQNRQSFAAGCRINTDNLLITTQLRDRDTNYDGVNIEPSLTVQ